jgi:predicted HTH transcriptional regulator
VIVYEGKDRLKRIKEVEGDKGYASGFVNLIGYINTLLPSNEVIKEALRKEVKVYPELAVRELVANALIHQDFDVTGSGPTIEIFEDRLEIRNPGRPLIKTERFIDYPPRSRNEMLAALMRRLGICEESGTGIDKAVSQCEVYQLPPPLFVVNDDHLVSTLFAPRSLTRMAKEDRIRACYQHACLKYVSGDFMTNESIRKRFGIEAKSYPVASKIIADTLQTGIIQPRNPDSKSRKHAQYIPFWA